MKQTKWFDRKFNFDVSAHTFPAILERLAGTALRLEDMTQGLSDGLLMHSIDKTWTIKENIGHLADLEVLWQDRLTDILESQPELRQADLMNSKTHQGKHNDKSILTLLGDFKELREKTLHRLKKLDHASIVKSALHPRIKTQMRTIDLFYFVAEHDDHHLARITEIINAR